MQKVARVKRFSQVDRWRDGSFSSSVGPLPMRMFLPSPEKATTTMCRHEDQTATPVHAAHRSISQTSPALVLTTHVNSSECGEITPARAPATQASPLVSDAAQLTPMFVQAKMCLYCRLLTRRRHGAPLLPEERP
jgi:hypothetical protein